MRTTRRGLIYTALVRYMLDSDSVVNLLIRLPGHIQRIQKTQDRFMRMVGVNLGVEYGQVPMGRLEVTLVLEPLATRQQLQDIMFLHKVIIGEVDYPQPLYLFALSVLDPTWPSDFFCRPECYTNYELHSTILWLHRLENMVTSVCVFFLGTVATG